MKKWTPSEGAHARSICVPTFFNGAEYVFTYPTATLATLAHSRPLPCPLSVAASALAVAPLNNPR